ncbi:MAG: o-succinylbenzoate synthase [Flavobacteriia bacterium]|nr:o-succinylbenzoate synthase [Flavobacteriia bacterium]
MKARWIKHELIFKQPAGTSRGVLKTKETYYIIAREEGKYGVGECGLLKGLSPDDVPEYEEKLDEVCKYINKGMKYWYPRLAEFPSIQFGLEQATRDVFTAEPLSLFDTFYSRGEEGQAINGLIWMGDEDFMRKQVDEKIEAGFRCLKMKIGAIDWETERGILKSIRERYSASELELRVDANGAFQPQDTPAVLDQLKKLDIHSIEQPIKAGQWDAMAKLCESTPVPIALDEELIGVHDYVQRQELLDTIKPQYIILKPSFIGGWIGSRDWINRAEKAGIGWWVTSALESNVGLNAIAEWTSTLGNEMPQGLGTGSLYTNNIEGPLYIYKGHLVKVQRDWDLSLFDL